MITAPPPVETPKNYINATQGLKSWLLTKDHKRIGLLYLIGSDVFLRSRRDFCGADSSGVGHSGGRSGRVEHL